MTMVDLAGERAVATGANSGIGAVVAAALGRAGARVSIIRVTDSDAGVKLADDVGRHSGTAVAIEADVTGMTVIVDGGMTNHASFSHGG